MQASAAIEAEYRGGDPVLWGLVAVEVRRAAATASWSRLQGCVECPVAEARDAATRLVIRWPGRPASPLQLVARHAAADAVAAESLRGQFPNEAEQLATPWETAVRVRGLFRELGPTVEEVALRMLSSWLLPLDQLPATARAIVAPGP